MVIKHKEQRVTVLIDVQNMYHSAKNLYGKKVNFAEILKTAVGERKLIRAFAYMGGNLAMSLDASDVVY